MILSSNEAKIEKIKYNGVEGYFINQAYYNQILVLEAENKSFSFQISEYENQKKRYEELMLINDNIEKSLKNELKDYERLKRYNNIKNYMLTGSIALDIVLAGVLACVIIVGVEK